MENVLKTRLLLYALLSAVGFTYLILADNAGISVPLFILMQFLCLLWLAPAKKALYMFIPVFILSLNSFISGNTIWRTPNFFVILLLYSAMTLIVTDRFPIKKVSPEFIFDTLENVFKPCKHITLPFKWCGDINREKYAYIKRIAIGVFISIPCILFLLVMLSSADSVFSHGVGDFFDSFRFLNFDFVLKVIFGALAGLYLFGMLYMTYVPGEKAITAESKEKSGDLLILNILMVSVLIVYTLFIIIQFRYLFAGGQLPYGLTYAEYARKGFFELLFLSGVNILLILVTVGLIKEKQGLWAGFTRSSSCYLCFVTVILLVSSFYRMWLYNSDYGLTRLRLLVFGFLIFETAGLLITFFYILKPRFNITAVYTIIALTYYLIINLTPIDYIIAGNKVDRYLHKENAGIDYAVTLSTDAAPQIARLLSDTVSDEAVKEKAREYFKNIDGYYNKSYNSGWRSYNISIDRAIKLLLSV